MSIYMYIVFIPEPKCRQIWILMFYSFLIVHDLIGRLIAWKGDTQRIKDFFSNGSNCRSDFSPKFHLCLLSKVWILRYYGAQRCELESKPTQSLYICLYPENKKEFWISSSNCMNYVTVMIIFVILLFVLFEGFKIKDAQN